MNEIRKYFSYENRIYQGEKNTNEKLNDAENKKLNNSNKLNGKSLVEQIMWRTECPGLKMRWTNWIIWLKYEWSL